MRRLAPAVLGILAVSLTAAAPPVLMGPHDLQAIPFEQPDATIAYGSDAEQIGELRVPAGPGPHPVVILIHGGCFKAAYATKRDLAPIADALKAQGIASWNIEYRRLGQAGGGWPGTYQDVGRAIDHLRTIAPQHNLDLGRVIVVGHSAGGHLASWAAARKKLPATSAVSAPSPLPLRGAIDLAGPFDMRENIANYHAECGDPVITQMLGGTPAEVPDRYREASAGAQLPLGVPLSLIWGEHETFMPHGLALDFVDRAKAAGDQTALHVARGAGHFEIASPHSSAWPLLLGEINRLLGPADRD